MSPQISLLEQGQKKITEILSKLKSLLIQKYKILVKKMLKMIIGFSVSLQSVAELGNYLTFCRFAMGGIFTTNVDAEHKTFGYHYTACVARNPAYYKCAFNGWAFVSLE